MNNLEKYGGVTTPDYEKMLCQNVHPSMYDTHGTMHYLLDQPNHMVSNNLNYSITSSCM
jgi:hypothetical protein